MTSSNYSPTPVLTYSPYNAPTISSFFRSSAARCLSVASSRKPEKKKKLWEISDIGAHFSLVRFFLVEYTDRFLSVVKRLMALGGASKRNEQFNREKKAISSCQTLSGTETPSSLFWSKIPNNVPSLFQSQFQEPTS